MDEQLEAIEKQVNKRDYDSPPLHLWDPPLSGEIDILIAADGTWYHEGGKIERESIVRLFAAILRREEDNQYYLVTPGEKWRIQVELHPLLVTDVERDISGHLKLTLNTGRQVWVCDEYPLFLEPSVGGVAGARLDHGLTAIFSRSAWYRLVDLAETDGDVTLLASGDYVFELDGNA